MSRDESNLRIAIVGASSLQGKELKQLIEDEYFPAANIALIDTSLPVGTLAEAGGEPTFLKPMDRDSFEGVRFVFFCGSRDEARSNWKLATAAGATIIDLTGALEETGAAPWIPDLDTILAPPEANPKRPHHPGIYSSPASAVMIACRLTAALAKFSPGRIAITFFPPASERDQAGVDELEKQTADLLLLRPIAQGIFDAQIAFNLLASYGDQSRPSLAEMRAQVQTSVAEYLNGRMPLPAMQMIQAPVFYGCAFSTHVDLPGQRNAAEIDAALVGAGMHVTGKDDPKPTNVTIAGESKIHVTRLDPAAADQRSLWLWGVADNLRLGAVNAVEIARELLAPKI